MKKLLISLLFVSPVFSFAQQIVTEEPGKPQLNIKSGKVLKNTGAVLIGTGFLVMAIGAVSDIGKTNFTFNNGSYPSNEPKPKSNSSSTIVAIGAGMVVVGFPLYFIGRSKIKKLSTAIRQQPLNNSLFKNGMQTQFSVAYHF
jgi:hypothetical protein